MAHAMATAIVCGERLRATTFGEFKNDYVCIPPDGLNVIIKGSYFWEVVRCAEQLLRMVFRFNRIKIRHVLTLASSWHYRDEKALARCEDEIRNFFRPVNVDNVRQVLVELKHDGKALIGVHIRRRDYKVFLNGRYYYEDAVYRREMERVLRFVNKEGQKVVFIVFSDEEINESHFEGLPCFFAHGTAVEDQWLMSQCDYLMGPPSTFSAWASFMGKVPIAKIWNEEYQLNLEDFAYRGLVA